LEEYFYSKGVCVIEWAEKGLPILPQENLFITLNYVSHSETERTIYFTSKEKRYLELISQLKLALNKKEIWN